jgi:TonB family protein
VRTDRRHAPGFQSGGQDAKATNSTGGRKGMPYPARIAQVRALEIPVTVEGSRAVPGTERRELFTEPAKTTLIFDNGAVLNLRSRVLPGQAVFLRNDQSGREILCRVLEAPPEGRVGYTDLEFAFADPEFWAVHAEQHEKAGAKPEAQEAVRAAESAVETPSATTPTMTTPNVEPSAPTREEISAAFPETPAPPPSPLHEATESLPVPEDAVESSDAADEENLAALMALSAKRVTKSAVAAKEEEAEKIDPVAALADASEDEVTTEPAGEARAVRLVESLAHRSTTGKNSLGVGIAAALLTAVLLGLLGHAVRGSLFDGSDRPPAASGQSTRPGPPAALRPSPASTVATGGAATAAAASRKPNHSSGGPGAEGQVNDPGATPIQGTSKAPAATSAAPGGAPGGEAPQKPLATAEPEMETDRNMLASDQAGGIEHRKLRESNSEGAIPAKIVWQFKPSFPPWAKGLEVDGVVKLEAVIDEKGNLTGTRLLSGPHLLQHAAEQAVGLWIFEPAQSDGKPTTTHMVLTVEFQR